MRILVTGASGQVGRSMLDLNGQDGHEIIGLTRQQFDLTKPEEFDRIVDQIEPDAIVNAAAYTAVDQAEDEPELAHQINAVAPGVMSTVAAKSKLPFIQISTDYVFDGNKLEPYTERDKTAPVNVYGETKRAGELTVRDNHECAVVLRTSWVFSNYGKNFFTTIIKTLGTGKRFKVVDDQLGCPTLALDVAKICIRLAISLRLGGIFHFSGSESMTWFGFAKLIAECRSSSEIDHIEPCRTEDYITKATRPRNTRLDNSKINERFTPTNKSINQLIKECIDECS